MFFLNFLKIVYVAYYLLINLFILNFLDIIKYNNINYFQLFPIVISSVFSSVYFFFTINALDVASIISPENVVSGLLRRDTLYHASIASMIREYGISSTGLDGLVLTPYYTLSHLWLGLMAKGVHLDTVTGYYLGHQLVLVPLMVFSLLRLTNALTSRGEDEADAVLNPIVPVFALILLSYFDFKSYLISETQALGLILISAGAVFLKQIAEQSAGRITHSKALFGALLAMLMVAAKISTGFAFISGFTYLLLRTRKVTLFQSAYLLALAIAFLFFTKSYLVPDSHAQQTKLNFFHFFIAYKTVAWANLFVICLGAAVCGLHWVRGNLRSLQEALLVMMLACLLPALVLQIDGGSAYYFLNTGAWIAIAVCSAFVIHLTSQIKGIFWASSVALVALLTIEAVKSHTVEAFTAKIDRLQTALYGTTLPQVVGPFDFGALEKIAAKVPEMPLSRLAVTLNRTAGSQRDALVFISPELFRESPYACTDAPFFVPAFVGLPMLMAVPTLEKDCKTGPHYSFPSYTLPQAFNGPPTDIQLCEAAALRNFDRVIAVENVDRARAIDCVDKG